MPAGAADLTHTTLYRIVGDDLIKGRFKNEAVLAELDRADAIIFGCPTFMGSVSSEFKAFADASGWRGDICYLWPGGSVTVPPGTFADTIPVCHHRCHQTVARTGSDRKQADGAVTF